MKMGPYSWEETLSRWTDDFELVLSVSCKFQPVLSLNKDLDVSDDRRRFGRRLPAKSSIMWSALQPGGGRKRRGDGQTDRHRNLTTLLRARGDELLLSRDAERLGDEGFQPWRTFNGS